MFRVVFGFLALVLVVSGGLCVYETRSYTDGQRARAPRLWQTYVAGVFPCLVGVGNVAWLLNGGSVRARSGIGSVAAALPCLVRARLHRQLSADRSPSAARLAEKVARTLTFPESDRQV